jgi:hypothetical protein
MSGSLKILVGRRDQRTKVDLTEIQRDTVDGVRDRNGTGYERTRQKLVSGSCKHGNVLLSSTKGGEFHDKMRDS